MTLNSLGSKRSISCKESLSKTMVTEQPYLFTFCGGKAMIAMVTIMTDDGRREMNIF